MSFNTTQMKGFSTPAYVYNTQLLNDTLESIKAETCNDPAFCVHYAIKANDQHDILTMIAKQGFGADCVSGGEVRASIEAGFPAELITFAGVGKADWEIVLALENGIGMFNVESREEMEVISEIATAMNKVAHISLRINPDVHANTHAHITTGRAENKFGIASEDMLEVVRLSNDLPGLSFEGLHFHIGSQLLDMSDFEALCLRINQLQDKLESAGFHAKNINVGGGLGVDYEHPQEHPIANFKAYFSTFRQHLQLRQGQRLHFELGRSIVAQAGILLSKVLYVKHTATKNFVILDAGMTELLRPALYGALHKIENLSAEERHTDESPECVDVVGPICESSDVFARDYLLPHTQRGDLVAIRTAGAYGQTMASTYNHRPLPKVYFI